MRFANKVKVREVKSSKRRGRSAEQNRYQVPEKGDNAGSPSPNGLMSSSYGPTTAASTNMLASSAQAQRMLTFGGELSQSAKPEGYGQASFVDNR